MTKIQIGIDVAKYTHVFAVMSSDGEVLVEPTSFENNIQGFSSFFKAVEDFKSLDHIVSMESTGHYHENLLTKLVQYNFNCALINPIITDKYRQTKSLRKTKTDKIDSLMLCELAQTFKLKKVTIKTVEMIELKKLTRYLNKLKEDSSKIKIEIKTSLDTTFPEYAKFFSSVYGKASLALLSQYGTADEIYNLHLTKLTNIMSKASKGRFKKQRCKALKELAKTSIGDNNQSKSLEIRQAVQRLNLFNSQIEEIIKKIEEIVKQFNSPIFSIPGIGLITGASILAEIGDINNFSSSSKLLAFAGCDPSVFQSGTYEAVKSRITKRGSPYLRKALYQIALTCSNNNTTFNKYYIKKINEGKRHRNAQGHLINKIVRVIYKLLTTNTMFNPELCI
jgi:transposase